jgi:hypothetical protein
MSQPPEDWFIELCGRGDSTVLKRLPRYLDQELARAPNVAAERARIAKEFRDRAPDSELKQAMLEIIAA